MVGEVFKNLLMVAIADPDASIRQTVLASFRPQFYPFLCQTDNLRLLFLGLHDESFRVREVRRMVVRAAARCVVRR
jgi:FKBP12-rapamycin complex-associated protein